MDASHKMLSNKREQYNTVAEAFRGLAGKIDFYCVLKERLELSLDNKHVLEFFSRSYLSERKWSVVPLWEASIDVLLNLDGTSIPFLASLCERCLNTGGQYIYTAAIAKVESEQWAWSFSPRSASMYIAARKFDLANNEDPSDIFKLSQDNTPYPGTTFIWPSNERFLIYTDGDNASFVTGNKEEILELLGGITYEYCVDRFIKANSQLKDHSVTNAWVNFCNEFK